MSQFDAKEAARLRDDGCARVEENASDFFKHMAMEAIQKLAKARPQLTSDDVWAVLEKQGVPSPHEPRVMGALFRTAASYGWIKDTETFRKSARKASHRRHIQIWDSKLFRPEQ